MLIYNPSQEGSDPTTNIQDLTLKFYNASNNVVISIDGGCGTSCTNSIADPLYFGNTGVNLGNGGAGFALTIDATQAAQINAACGAVIGVNFGTCTSFALETTIWNANDGPDSFYLYTINGVTVCDPNVPGSCPGPQNFNVPEPITLSLFGAGLAGAAAMRRRKKKIA